MSGHSKVEELQKETKEILDFKQQLQFREMKDKLEPDIDSRIRWQGTIFLFDATNSLLQFTTGNWLAGTCWLLAGSIYFRLSYLPYKLKKEIKLVTWVIENKEYVDEVIKTEVERKMPITTETDTMIPVKQEYPTGLVPYSENLYEEGINLNNIDELNVKVLRKLKKKATKIRGEKDV